MIGLGFNTANLASGGGSTPSFSPLDLSPVFWFDFSKYSAGAYTGTEVDETGNYTLTPKNGALSASDGVNQAFATNGTNAYALDYGATFNGFLKNDHTRIIFYKPNVASVAVQQSLVSVTDFIPSMRYNIWRQNNKIRLFLYINSVFEIFDSVADVFTTTDYYSILVEVKSTGVAIEVNGVNVTLTKTTFTEPLANLNISTNPYLGARNKENTSIDLLSDGFFGDDLLYSKVLTPTEKTNLLNYFV